VGFGWKWVAVALVCQKCALSPTSTWSQLIGSEFQHHDKLGKWKIFLQQIYRDFAFAPTPKYGHEKNLLFFNFLIRMLSEDG